MGRYISLLVLALVILSVLPINVANAQEGTQQNPQTPPANETQTTNTTVEASANQTNENIEPFLNMIHFAPGERIIGVCYPWVVFRHNFLDLSTWTITPGIGGDISESVTCLESYIVVKGKNGVYIVDRKTGEIKEAIPTNNLVYIGVSEGSIAFLDVPDNTVIVHTPFTGDMHIPLPNGTVVDIKFGVYTGVPFVAYILDKNSTRILYLANPMKTRQVAVLSNTSDSLYIYKNYIIVEDEGLKTYRITDATSLDYTECEKYRIYLPFDIKKILSGDLDTLYVNTWSGILVSVSLTGKTWKMLGEAQLTPAGLFVYNPSNPELSTTYVPINNTWYPVPGEVVGTIGYLAFTNYFTSAGEHGVETIPVLYPILKSNLVVTKPLEGLLQIPDNGDVKVIKISLMPGVYTLPMYSTILTDVGAIALTSDEVRYPPVVETPPEIRGSLVNYTVVDFPSKFSTIDTIKDVKYVTSGAGKLLIITSKAAIVYTEYGISTIIPGVWKWGGIGDKIVLYDGATFRVFDYAGNPVEAYQTYIAEKPIYVTYDNGEIHLYGKTYHIVLTKDGIVKKLDFVAALKYDAVYGTSVFLTEQPEVKYGEFTFRIPAANTVTVNKYSVAWTYTSGNTTNWGILDIVKHRVYILLNAPKGVIYPLGDYIAYYNSTTVEILPFTSWIISKCFVDVFAPPEAMIYINDKLVGTGTLRYYAGCYQRLTIKAVMPYHKPDIKEVVVKPGGVNVTLSPSPLIAKVKLEVLKPDELPVTSVTLTIDGKTTEWRVGEVKTLIAEKPYDIRVIAFHPFDVCDHPAFTNITFTEGENTLQIPCKLIGSVLGLKSKVPTTVIVTQNDIPVITASVGPDNPLFININPGEYKIVSKPQVKGYVARTLNVTIPSNQLVVVDVTPYKYSKLIVQAIPEIANIEVQDENGTVLGTGTGSLELELLPGNYTVIATAPGYQQYYETVTLEPGESKIVNITLIPIPTQPKQIEKPFWKDIRFQITTAAAVAGAVAFAIWYRKRKETQPVESEIVEGGE